MRVGWVVDRLAVMFGAQCVPHSIGCQAPRPGSGTRPGSSGTLPSPTGSGSRQRSSSDAMVALAQWQSSGLWNRRLRVRAPQATPTPLSDLVGSRRCRGRPRRAILRAPAGPVGEWTMRQPPTAEGAEPHHAALAILSVPSCSPPRPSRWRAPPRRRSRGRPSSGPTGRTAASRDAHRHGFGQPLPSLGVDQALSPVHHLHGHGPAGQLLCPGHVHHDAADVPSHERERHRCTFAGPVYAKGNAIVAAMNRGTVAIRVGKPCGYLKGPAAVVIPTPTPTPITPFSPGPGVPVLAPGTGTMIVTAAEQWDEPTIPVEPGMTLDTVRVDCGGRTASAAREAFVLRDSEASITRRSRQAWGRIPG